MPKDDAFNNTSEHPEDIIAELRAGLGVLSHLGASLHEVTPEEIGFLVDKLSETLNRLQRSLTDKRGEPQP